MPRDNSGADKIKLNPSIAQAVEQRIREFEELGRKGWKDWFRELCFCILTANFTAEGGIRIQREVGDGFLSLSERDLAEKLRELGHRFPRTRARYIVEARRFAPLLKKEVTGRDGKSAREWLLQIKGIGMKEASHFLRNVGFKDVAIIDRHILNLLAERGLIENPKALTKRKYLEIEQLLERIARELGTDLARLDLYLWHEKTGKVLK